MKLLAPKLSVLVASIAMTLALAEAAMRVVIPPCSDESIFEYRLDTPRRFVMKPDTSVIAWGEELRTNVLGFRDLRREVPAKAPGEYRIVVLGDSFTVNAGVPFDRVYTSVLETQLRKTDPQVRVINLGVSGYNIVQYQHTLQEVGLSLHPDMIVVAVFPENDFSNKGYDAALEVAQGKRPAIPSRPWYQESYVYRAYGARALFRAQRVLRRIRGEGVPPPGRAGDETPDGWQSNLHALSEIDAIARHEGISALYVALPSATHLDKQRELFDRVERACRSVHVPCVDLLARFLARGLQGKRLHLNALDAHPNDVYNAVLAEELVPLVHKARSARPAIGAIAGSH